MVRAPYYDKNGLKKGAWSREEDDKLITYVQRCGHPNWRQLPKFAGLNRCGKSCRLRWMNYLRPNLRHGNYTQEEEEMIINLHKKLGNKWAMIAERFPGRTDNEIKNHWHSHLKKRSETKPEFKPNPSNPVSEPKTTRFAEQEDPTNHAVFHNISEESSLSRSAEFESCCTEENYSSFASNNSESSMNWFRGEEDGVANSLQTCFEGFSNDFWTEPFILENSHMKDYDVLPIYQSDKADIASYLSYDSDQAADFLYQFMQYVPNCF